jgi:hypothetical protein
MRTIVQLQLYYNIDTERVRYAVADEGLYMTPHFRGHRVKNIACKQAGSAGKLAKPAI